MSANTRTRSGSVVAHRRLSSMPLPSPSASFLPTFARSSDSKNDMSLAVLSSFMAVSGRKFRIRVSFVALLALGTLAVFCVLHQHLGNPPLKAINRLPNQHWEGQMHSPHRSIRPTRSPQLSLSSDEELAALIAFMAALPSNALPDSVNVSSIDPDLILDFDTRSPKAVDELRQLVDSTWTRLPIVLLSQRYSPIGREIKTILAEFNLKPALTVFDIDDRVDETAISPILLRLTKQDTFPILLLSGKPVGSIFTIRELHISNHLRDMIVATGAVINGTKKLNKGRRRAT